MIEVILTIICNSAVTEFKWQLVLLQQKNVMQI